ncbi:MAG: HNH endonuclease [Nocardioides sp.]
MDSELLCDLTDHVLPGLPPYEFTLYVLLLRLTDFEGGEAQVGKRTISSLLGKGTRSTGGNYQHITKKVNSLEESGFVTVLDTHREGTRYLVRLPRDVPSVRERVAASESVPPVLNYFTDPALREELMERDGWRCQYCGDPVGPGTATLDHVIPQVLKGSDEPDNLKTACLLCNSIKSGRSYADAAADILAAVARRRLAE